MVARLVMASLSNWDWTEPFAVLGKWTLADGDPYGTDATLFWDPEDGARLEFLESSVGAASDECRNTVYGLAENQYISLLDCQSPLSGLSVPGPSKVTIHVGGSVVIGFPLDEPHELVFDRLTLQLSGLSDLAPRIVRAEPLDRDASNCEEIVKLAEITSRSFKIARQESGESIELKARFGSSADDGLDWETVLEVRSPELKSFKAMTARVVSLQNLVTFLRRKPSAVLSIRLSGPEVASNIDGSRHTRGEVSVLQRLVVHPTTAREAGRSMWPICRLDSTYETFDRVLRSWFAFQERFAPVVDLRQASQYAGFTYGEQRLANAVQACEALDRRINPDSPDSDAAAKRDSVLAQVDVGDVGWLKQQLRFVHEPNLRKRLDRLFALSANVGLDISSRKRTSIAHRIASLRHQQTHWDPSNSAAVDPSALYHMAVLLEAVLDVLIAEEISLGDESSTDLRRIQREFDHSLSAL